MDTLAILARPGPPIPVRSIELWCTHVPSEFHWLITFIHPSGHTCASRESTVKWISNFPRERAIHIIRFSVTYYCPDLAHMASRISTICERAQCTSIQFVSYIIWDFYRYGYIEDTHTPTKDLLNEIITVKERLLKLNISENLSQYIKPLPEFLQTLPKATESDLRLGVLLLIPQGNQVLLIKRAKGNNHPGIWETPGRGVKQSDTSVVHAAVRECREQTQLHISHVGFALYQNWDRGNSLRHKLWFIVNVHENVCSDVTQLSKRIVLNSAEHESFWWATKEEIEGMEENAFLPDLKEWLLSILTKIARRGLG